MIPMGISRFGFFVSSAAVEIMDNTISEIKKTKSVYFLIKKGGLACSAMYGIISGSNKIYSESLMNIIGSVGTMIAFIFD